MLLLNKNFLFLTLLFFAQQLLAQIPVFHVVTPNNTSIQKFDKFELTIQLTAAYTNPFDYNDIAVKAVFTAPNGVVDSVDGFYMQDYTLNITNGSITPAGTGVFKVRFTPTQTGIWHYSLICTNTVGITTYGDATFTCVNSSDPGFIRKNNSNYLSFDDSSQYIPVGENMCWQDNNVYTDYSNWLNKLSNNGGNFIRVWMGDWSFALEWKGANYGGLKNYQQSNAYYLDWLLNTCKQKGVRIMLCLNHHGQVSTTVNPEWNNNPYNIANGGPCNNTWDFFSNSTAKNLFKNRMRYIIARYGYSNTIMSWELFNEVEWTDSFNTYKTNITNWHQEMAAYIKSKDVYQHLVTTSYAHDNNDPATWSLENIDFTQTHYYVGAPNLESILAAGSRSYIQQFKKPTLNGEFGINSGNVALSSIDPNGVYIHNTLWATALSGAMGTAMSWWWDNYIDPKNLYTHFKGISSFVNALNLKSELYAPVTATISGGGKANLTISPSAGWAAATAANFIIDASGNITPATTQLGQYLYGSVYNTQYKNPPVFTVTYPVSGQFKVVVNNISTAPQLHIYLDGKDTAFDTVANATYSINVSPGNHTIKVDNTGTDWMNISSYIFINVGSPVSAYVLQSAGHNKIAGWILNNQYNWSYMQNHNGVAPSAVNGAAIQIAGMTNSNYTVQWYNTNTDLPVGTATVTVNNGILSVNVPTLNWDLAFTAIANGCAIAKPQFSNSAYTICGNDSTLVSISNSIGSDSLFWNINGITNSSQQTQRFISNAGYVVVLRKNNAGCSIYSDTVFISKTAIPATPVVTIDGNNNLISSSPSGNQWYNDTLTAIANATAQLYKPTANGYYAVKVFQNGCSSAFSNRFNYIATAINVVLNSALSINPNPAQSEVFIHNNLTGVPILNAIIYNTAAQTVINQYNLKNGDAINISHLPAGVYYVHLYNQNLHFYQTQKLIKTY